MRGHRWYRDAYGLKDWIVAVIFVLVTVGFVGGAISTGLLLTRKACNEYSVETGYETTWNVWSGCYAETDSGVFKTSQIILNEGN